MSKYKPSAKMAKDIADAKAKAPKIKSDPDAPKRGRTSYIVFSDLHRPAIAAKNPKMKMTDLSVKLGAMWKKVSAAEKLKCEAIATKEKEAYEKAMKKYIPSDQYQAALDQLARAKAKLNGGDKKSKDTEKKKSVAAKAKTKKLKEDAKKKAAQVKKMEGEMKKFGALQEKLAAAKAKASAADSALIAAEGGKAKKKAKKAPPKIAEAVAVDGPKKTIKKKAPAAKKN